MNLLKGDKATKQDVIDFARELKAGWIIVETLARTMPGGNESAGEDMGMVIAALNEFREKIGAHVTAVHHLGKNQAAGARGWSGVPDAIETEIEIARDEDTSVAWLKKQRDGDDGVKWAFTLKKVALDHQTFWGKPVTSCVVEWTDAPTERAKLRGASLATLKIFAEMERTNRDGVPYEEFIAACSEPGRVCSSKREKTRKDVCCRTLRSLSNRGFLDHHGNKIQWAVGEAQRFENLDEPGSATKATSSNKEATVASGN